MESDRFRRPSPGWCIETAVRLLRIGCRDEELLEPEERTQLVAAAGLIDQYGQRLMKHAAQRDRARS